MSDNLDAQFSNPAETTSVNLDWYTPNTPEQAKKYNIDSLLDSLQIQPAKALQLKDQTKSIQDSLTAEVELPKLELDIDIPVGTDIFLAPGKLAYIILQFERIGRYGTNKNKVTRAEAQKAITLANLFSGDTERGIDVIFRLSKLGLLDLDKSINELGQLDPDYVLLMTSLKAMTNLQFDLYYYLSQRFHNFDVPDFSNTSTSLKLLSALPEQELWTLASLIENLTAQGIAPVSLEDAITHQSEYELFLGLPLSIADARKLNRQELFKLAILFVQEPLYTSIRQLGSYGVKLAVSDLNLRADPQTYISKLLTQIETNSDLRRNVIYFQLFEELGSRELLHTDIAELLDGNLHTEQRDKVLMALRFIQSLGTDVAITPTLCQRLVTEIDEVIVPAGIAFNPEFSQFQARLSQILINFLETGSDVTGNYLQQVKYEFAFNSDSNSLTNHLRFAFDIYQKLVSETQPIISNYGLDPKQVLSGFYERIFQQPGIERALGLIYGYGTSRLIKLLEWYSQDQSWNKIFEFLQKILTPSYLSGLFSNNQTTSRRRLPGFEELLDEIFATGSLAEAEKLIADAKSVVLKYEKEGIPVPVSPLSQSAAVKPSGDAKSQADQRLKAELEKLENQQTEGEGI